MRVTARFATSACSAFRSFTALSESPQPRISKDQREGMAVESLQAFLRKRHAVKREAKDSRARQVAKPLVGYCTAREVQGPKLS